jgi:hypothetical protein
MDGVFDNRIFPSDFGYTAWMTVLVASQFLGLLKVVVAQLRELSLG